MLTHRRLRPDTGNRDSFVDSPCHDHMAELHDLRKQFSYTPRHTNYIN